MHFLLIIIALANAAKMEFCTQDISEFGLSSQRGKHWLPENFHDRAVRPGFGQLRSDVCRCLPRMRKNYPDTVKATLHIQPNQGSIRVEYTVEPLALRAQRKMAVCMGEPTITGKPMAYSSDIVYPDGREEVLRFPFIVQLVDKRTRRDASN